MRRLLLIPLLLLGFALAQDYDATMSYVAATIFANDLGAVVDTCPAGIAPEMVCLRFYGDMGRARSQLDAITRTFTDISPITAWTAGEGDFYARILRVDDGLIIGLGVVQLQYDRTIIVVGAGYP